MLILGSIYSNIKKLNLEGIFIPETKTMYAMIVRSADCCELVAACRISCSEYQGWKYFPNLFFLNYYKLIPELLFLIDNHFNFFYVLSPNLNQRISEFVKISCPGCQLVGFGGSHKSSSALSYN